MTGEINMTGKSASDVRKTRRQAEIKRKKKHFRFITKLLIKLGLWEELPTKEK